MSSAGSLASPPAPPPDWQATAAGFGIESPARAAIERVINPADYECGPSELDAVVDELLAEMTPATTPWWPTAASC